MATVTSSRSRLRRTVGAVNWLGLLVVASLVILWQVLVGSGTVNSTALPAPVDIWHGAHYLSTDEGGLWAAIGHTVRVVLLAWVIGTVLGGLLGALVSANATISSWLGASFDLLRSLPVVALIPIAILLWGTGNKTEVILGAYAALWPMMINTSGGVRAITPRLREVARTLDLGRVATLRKVVLPAAGPAMLVGARLALASTLVICVVAEMLGLQSGVGNQLVLEQSGMQPARMWVYVLTVGVLGLLANAGLMRAFRLLFPGVAAVAERSGR